MEFPNREENKRAGCLVPGRVSVSAVLEQFGKKRGEVIR